MKSLANTFFVIVLLYCSTQHSFAQDTMVSATAFQFFDNDFVNTFDGKERKSFFREQEDILIKQALRKALFKAYPSSISAASVKYSENIKFNQFDAKTKSVYKRFMYDFANGEIVKRMKEDCKQYVKDDEYCLECSVSILAREIQNPKTNLLVYTCDGQNAELDKETDFNSGQDFYLYFKTPLSGYLAVYFDNFEETQRILPYYYDTINESCIQVKADTPYFLFSKNEKHDGYNKLDLVDELSLTASSDYDLNRLYVIFSESPFTKPMLEVHEASNLEAHQNSEYLKPKESQSEQFMEWLQQNRLQNEDFQILAIDITIKK